MARPAVLVSMVMLTAVACSGGSDVVSSATPLAESTTTVVDTTTTVAATTTAVPTSVAPATTVAPTTVGPTTVPSTAAPTTAAPPPVSTTLAPATTLAPVTVPVTAAPTTAAPATTVPCRVPGLNDIVRRGDCGDTVRFIQERLTVLGFPAAADGLFGPGTETAVKNFQSSRGLVADGIVGPLTWDKLVEGGIGD